MQSLQTKLVSQKESRLQQTLMQLKYSMHANASSCGLMLHAVARGLHPFPCRSENHPVRLVSSTCAHATTSLATVEAVLPQAQALHPLLMRCEQRCAAPPACPSPIPSRSRKKLAPAKSTKLRWSGTPPSGSAQHPRSSFLSAAWMHSLARAHVPKSRQLSAVAAGM